MKSPRSRQFKFFVLVLLLASATWPCLAKSLSGPQAEDKALNAWCALLSVLATLTDELIFPSGIMMILLGIFIFFLPERKKLGFVFLPLGSLITAAGYLVPQWITQFLHECGVLQ